MSLLQQIQESIVEEGFDLASVLLKLRILATRLRSDTLEEWLKHESEGYPDGADVPAYRTVGVSYRGTFSGSFGSRLQNAPIPPYLINKYAGEVWTRFKVRKSIAAVEEMRKSNKNNKPFVIDASNLILLLQDQEIYKDYVCNDISGSIAPTSFYEILQTVRNRILELTLKLEQSVPGAMHVTFGAFSTSKVESNQVQQILQQIIYGNVNTAIAGGSGSNIAVSITERDNDSFIKHLVEKGIPESDASDLATIMETEEPSSAEDPFGKKARNWIVTNLKKAAEGSWKVSASVATKLLTEATLKYYGIK